LKLGLSTWSLLGIDVYAAVKAIGEAGVDYIELWGELPHAYPDWVDRKRLKDALSSYDMTVSVHAPFTDLNPSAPDEHVRSAVQKVLEAFVDFSASLGAVMVTVHPGNVHNERLVGGAAPSSIETVRKMIRRADGRLYINIENQTRSASKYNYPLGSSLDSLEALLAGTEGSKCTFDTGHAHASGIDIVAAAGRLGSKVAEVHLSDNNGSADEHLVPGEGTAPLKGFSGRLGAAALVCLELNPHVYSADEVLKGYLKTKEWFGGDQSSRSPDENQATSK
jgi:sugar phosphate isomerase/epimerase